MKKISSSLFLALIAVFATITPAHALLPYETIQITHNDYWDYHPDINNNGYIVWDADDGSGYKIYQYDGSTITALPNSNGGSDPRINNDGHVVWHDASYNVFLYDGSVTAPIGSGLMADLNDYGYVTWQDSGNIRLYNGSTTISIGSGAGGSSRPRINNNGHVVWDDTVLFYLYNGSTTSLIGSGIYPAINDNGYIVYDTGGIVLYDGSTSTPISSSGEIPNINNNGYIVWYDPHGITGEIFLYDGSTTTQMTNNSYKDYFPNINDREDIVWQGQIDDDFEIFLARPVPEPSSFSFLLLGFGLIGAALRRKKA